MDLEDDDSEINVANGNLSKDTNSSEGENIQNIGDHSEPKKIKLSVSTNVPHTRVSCWINVFASCIPYLHINY